MSRGAETGDRCSKIDCQPSFGLSVVRARLSCLRLTFPPGRLVALALHTLLKNGELLEIRSTSLAIVLPKLLLGSCLLSRRKAG